LVIRGLGPCCSCSLANDKEYWSKSEHVPDYCIYSATPEEKRFLIEENWMLYPEWAIDRSTGVLGGATLSHRVCDTSGTSRGFTRLGGPFRARERHGSMAGPPMMNMLDDTADSRGWLGEVFEYNEQKTLHF
jgi:hypothetical protein